MKPTAGDTRACTLTGSEMDPAHEATSPASSLPWPGPARHLPEACRSPQQGGGGWLPVRRSYGIKSRHITLLTQTAQ